MMTVQKKQTGFTLVEIAIVLVIIGLLLGGILKGQELVTSARVRNLADQNSGVQAAYYGFIDRYRNLPGDMTPANATAAIGNNLVNLVGVGGNGDGQLNEGSFQEATALWAHLAGANFLTGGYPGDAAGAVNNVATYAAPNAQGLDVSPKNAFLGPVLLGNLDEYLVPAPPAPVAAIRLAYVFGNQIPVNVMRELDVKIDDSIPDTGVMRAGAAADNGVAYTGVAIEGGFGAPGAAPCTIAGGAGQPPLIWNINGNSQNCNALYIY